MVVPCSRLSAAVTGTTCLNAVRRFVATLLTTLLCLGTPGSVKLVGLRRYVPDKWYPMVTEMKIFRSLWLNGALPTMEAFS